MLMEFIIVTGMSGAGKSLAVDVLEDIGFYCVDNMPPKLISKFAELCAQSNDKISRAAIVTDARGGILFDDVFAEIAHLKKQGYQCHILFLDASDEVLVRRFKETRRRHPLTDMGSQTVEEAIATERKMLSRLYESADYIVNTSLMSPSQLRERIVGLFLEDRGRQMTVNCVSFGFKHGIPSDADLLFDVRCLPNPFYIDKLKNQTGLQKPVQDYIFKSEESVKLLQKLIDLLDFTIPLYQKEGKSQLVVAIGCTGGHHRSVAFAHKINEHLVLSGVHSTVIHRDIHR